MARTETDFVKEYVDYLDEQQRMSNEPSRPIEGKELELLAARWDKMMEETYPNGINAVEVEQAAERWEETVNIAESVLIRMAREDQLMAKIEELKDDKGRLEVELGNRDALVSGLSNENEWLRYRLSHRDGDRT
jgi:hypothetical protein